MGVLTRDNTKCKKCRCCESIIVGFSNLIELYIEKAELEKDIVQETVFSMLHICPENAIDYETR